MIFEGGTHPGPWLPSQASQELPFIDGSLSGPAVPPSHGPEQREGENGCQTTTNSILPAPHRFHLSWRDPLLSESRPLGCVI